MPLAASNVTAKLNVAVAESPSVTEGDDTDIVGGSSSSVIVPVATSVDPPLDSVAFDTDDRVSLTVSLCSSTSSPVTVTATVLAVCPAVNVNVAPVTAV